MTKMPISVKGPKAVVFDDYSFIFTTYRKVKSKNNVKSGYKQVTDAFLCNARKTHTQVDFCAKYAETVRLRMQGRCGSLTHNNHVFVVGPKTCNVTL